MAPKQPPTRPLRNRRHRRQPWEGTGRWAIRHSNELRPGRAIPVATLPMQPMPRRGKETRAPRAGTAAEMLPIPIKACMAIKQSQVKFYSSRRQKIYVEAVGQTGAQGLVRGCGPHCPPVSRKNPARDEAPRAGRGGASFPGLISCVRVLSPALSGGRHGFRRGRGG